MVAVCKIALVALGLGIPWMAYGYSLEALTCLNSGHAAVFTPWGTTADAMRAPAGGCELDWRRLYQIPLEEGRKCNLVQKHLRIEIEVGSCVTIRYL